MDIKLKNRKSINVLVFIMVLYMMAFSALNIIDCMANRKYFQKDYYFKSNSFYSILNGYYSRIVDLNGRFKDYEKKSFEEKVDKDKLENEISLEKDAIYNRYNELISQAAGKSNNEKEVENLKKQREKEIDEFLKNIKDKDSAIMKKLKENVVKIQDLNYNNVKSYLQKREEIKYYIRNEKDGSIYTNLEEEEKIKNSLFTLEFPKTSPSTQWEKEMSSYFENEDLKGYFTAAPDDLKDSVIFEEYNRSLKIRNRIIKEVIICSIVLVLVYFILRYLKEIGFFKENFLGIKRLYKKITLDFQILLFLSFSLVLYYEYENYVFYNNINMSMILELFLLVVYIFYLIIAVGEVMIVLKDKKQLKNQWEKSFLYKIFNSLKDSFIFKNIGFKMLMIIFATIFLGIILSAAVVVSEVFLIPLAIYMLFYIVFIMYNIFKKVGYFNKILKGTEEMVSGHLDYTIDEKGTNFLSKLASNINNIKEGYKRSLDGSIKSERLKSELITNVSHDLKTPLTSIINYIDLLKQQDLSKDEIEGYVAVLDRKSKRLKDLIEDLFEASKVTSGAVELNIERVDIVALMKQALGEYHEKIKNSSLDFKVNLPNKNVFLNLDGKKTWRVFHNLISNALKYSQPNTRVYIDLLEAEQEVTVTIKNIACYEMNFNPDEIFERFKRGDESRSTEGSGLGLAIAKSIVELQKGKLDIVVDGDLFKAIIKFNK